MLNPLDQDEIERKYLSNIAQLFKTIGAQEGTCRGCGVPVWWVRTKNGKLAPFTAEGLNHFADCPKAGQFRNKKGTKRC